MKLGILLPIFSLPSNYGIGDFGKEANEFIDILSDNNIEYWEILPINEGGKYPYSPISYYALNKNYISIDKLIEDGFINKENVKYKEKNSRISYDNFKEQYYKEAYSNFVRNKEYNEFLKKIEIQQFCNYMSRKTGENVEYLMFLQFILDKQWKELRAYANNKNVKIIGDMPIYPNYNSAEVEYNPKCFELVNGKMEYVSGASPDYFNSEGQKWGHPLYDFKYMKNNNYLYLIRRYKEFLDKYDMVRIDHFRAFDTYYKIPVNGTAKEGFYVEGPGEEFLNKVFEFTTSDRFIVEDLGDIRKETEELRDKYNFTKMKIIQYTLNLENMKDEYEDSTNMVIYTGNHDNNTIVGWYNDLSDVQQRNLQIFLEKEGIYENKINEALIKYCLKSKAKFAIFPVQDIIGLNGNSRINLPGDENAKNNWSWELLDFNELKNNIHILK